VELRDVLDLLSVITLSKLLVAFTEKPPEAPPEEEGEVAEELPVPGELVLGVDEVFLELPADAQANVLRELHEALAAKLSTPTEELAPAAEY